MAEEDKNSCLEAEEAQAPAGDGPEEQQIVAETGEEKEPIQGVRSPNQKRGRMIAAGLVTAVILSVVAVLVAGVFQFGFRWLRPCSKDLPVNDPSPKFWQELVSEKVPAQTLGVPVTLAPKVQFKEAAPISEVSGADAQTTERK
ncbi:MAG: hypothetical protein WBG50_01160 [Desulfomonilaceae bacterium]